MAAVVRPTAVALVAAGPVVVPIGAAARAAVAVSILLLVAGWAAAVPSRAGSPIGRARQAYLRWKAAQTPLQASEKVGSLRLSAGRRRLRHHIGAAGHSFRRSIPRRIRLFVGCTLIIPMIIQTIRLDPSGSVWTDGASNVSRPDPSGAVQVDAGHPSRKRKVEGSKPTSGSKDQQLRTR